MKHLHYLMILAVAACATEPLPDIAERRPPPPGPTCSATIDLTSDPHNCGTCGTTCSSGLCYAGVCADATAGHAFVIGHGYSATGATVPALDRLLGNAVFLTDRPTVRVLAYSAYTPTPLIDGPNAAIDREATRRGRATTRTIVTNSADIQVLIGGADVFLVYAQPLVGDGQYLYFLGDEWTIPVDNFLRSGGVLVVLDAPGAATTAEILRRPGLMEIGPHAVSAAPFGYMTDPSDIAAARVSMIFDMSIADSVSWAPPSTGGIVVSNQEGNASVLHRSIY